MPTDPNTDIAHPQGEASASRELQAQATTSTIPPQREAHFVCVDALIAQATSCLQINAPAPPRTTTLQAPRDADDSSMYATPAATPPSTPRTAAARALRFLMTTPPDTSPDQLTVLQFFRGLQSSDDTSAIEDTYNRDTDWSSDTLGDMIFRCQGIVPHTGRVLGGGLARDPGISPASLSEFCTEMKRRCTALQGFPPPSEDPISLSSTYRWIDDAARHIFGAPPRR